MEPLKDARASWKKNYPGSDEFAAAVAILQAERIVSLRMTAILDARGLTMADWSVMTTLKFTETGELPLGKLADMLNVHGTTVTNAVDRLEKQGWVGRVPHAVDRRTIYAVLTDKGSQHLAAVQEALAESKFGLTALAPGERRDLAALLIKIMARDREEAARARAARPAKGRNGSAKTPLGARTTPD